MTPLSPMGKFGEFVGSVVWFHSPEASNLHVKAVLLQGAYGRQCSGQSERACLTAYGWNGVEGLALLDVAVLRRPSSTIPGEGRSAPQGHPNTCHGSLLVG